MLRAAGAKSLGDGLPISCHDGGYTEPDGTTFDLDTSEDGTWNSRLPYRRVGRGADHVRPYVGRSLPADASLADIAAAIGGRVQWFDLRDELEAQFERQFRFFNGTNFRGAILLTARSASTSR